jgi:hypothetical protein
VLAPAAVAASAAQEKQTVVAAEARLLEANIAAALLIIGALRRLQKATECFLFVFCSFLRVLVEKRQG